MCANVDYQNVHTCADKIYTRQRPRSLSIGVTHLCPSVLFPRGVATCARIKQDVKLRRGRPRVGRRANGADGDTNGEGFTIDGLAL